MGLFFYPRGGSAQVARYLSAALEDAGVEIHLASGSLGGPGERSHAPTFFGRHVLAGDYTLAARRFESGDDPMDANFPFQPSFEDRPGVPDRVFASVSPQLAEHQIAAWADLLRDTDWIRSEILHLHHLTPMHGAVTRLTPATPRISHLHGTELKFLDACRRGERDWPHADHWFESLRSWARDGAHVVCISPHDRDLACDLLGLPESEVSVVPNGVDTRRFDRRAVAGADRLAAWRHWLVEDPRGWDESGEPGSICYDDVDLAPFGPPDDPATVLLYVGRFLDFKRIPLLLRAYARARSRFTRPAPLVIWGGSPGEWEGTHPHRVVVGEGIPDVFFVGWRGHDELPHGLASRGRADGAVDRRAVRPGAARGDGRRPPRRGDPQRRSALVREHAPGRAERLARRARRRRAARRGPGQRRRGAPRA
ncbi:MAG: glycosyltransferase [Acidimicrobiia bacterium]|nr:glycosyltransferase [Acidimicrobiia bacterium]